MKNKPSIKKILLYCLLFLAVAFVVFLFVRMFFHWDEVSTFFSGILTSLRAIFIGCIMAYLFYPLTRYAEKRLLFRKVKPQTARTLSVAFSILALICILLLFVLFVIPELIRNIPSLMRDLPFLVDSSITKISAFVTSLGVSPDVIDSIFERLDNRFADWVQNNLLEKLLGAAESVVAAAKSVLNFIIGIIVMVYLLMSRDTFVGQGKMMLYATVKKRSACDKILYCVREVNKIFTGYVSGKLLDSFIVGCLCFLLMSLFQIPYALLISVIVGITDIIPVFGPFFGVIPSAILLLMVAPGKCIIFLILILVLQQIDGNIIAPHILGDSTGLSAFWVLFALLFFGHFMGFLGMLLGVPIFASIYFLIRELFCSSLRKKKLPTQAADYINIHNIDENGKITYKEPETIYFRPLFKGADSVWNELRRKRSGKKMKKSDKDGDSHEEK